MRAPVSRRWSRIGGALFVAAACLISTAARAQASYYEPAKGGRPQKLVCVNLELGTEVPCHDTKLFYEEAQVPMHKAFHASDFKTLDDIYAQWCKGTDRFPDGQWKLSQYGRSLADLFDTWNMWPKHLDTLKTWQQARPDSA